MAIDFERLRSDRDGLAAAAMAYSFETEVPRDRALLQTALASLAAGFADRSFTEAEALDAITQHGALLELRPSIAQELFAKVVQSGPVSPVSDTDPQSYSLDVSFLTECEQAGRDTASLLRRVIADLFEDLQLSASSKDTVLGMMKLVLSRTMQRFGRQYAYQAAGHSEGRNLVDYDELLQICQESAHDETVLPVTAQALAAAVAELFSSREEHFERFVFHLVQNYFHLRLLGLGGGLELIRGDRFQQAEFFLDTNVVVAFVVPHSRHQRSVLELLELAEQLSITLHVSEVTLEEFARVVGHNLRANARLYAAVPDELVPSTKDTFLKAFIEESKADPSLTAEAFLEGFQDIRHLLENDWGVTVLDSPVERDMAPNVLGATKKTLSETSKKVRHRSKGEAAVEHDAHLYHLVLSERDRLDGRSAWTLTLDTSLPPAAATLQGEDAVPFAMSLDGFLQIMSPYVRADHRRSFESLFVELMEPSLRPPEDFLDVSDFAMFVDQELTISQLPPEDVRTVIKGVRTALGTASVQGADKEKVAYEVRKALADPTLKYRVSAQQEINAQAKRIAQIRSEAEQAQNRYDIERDLTEAKHEAQMAELRASTAKVEQQAERKDGELEAALAAAARGKRILRASLAGTVALAALLAIWLVPPAASFSMENLLPIQLLCSAAVAIGVVGVATKSRVMEVLSLAVGVAAIAVAVLKK
jgi:predicted nucleic acid-binding protein